jgi:hypothetical protein
LYIPDRNSVPVDLLWDLLGRRTRLTESVRGHAHCSRPYAHSEQDVQNSQRMLQHPKALHFILSKECLSVSGLENRDYGRRDSSR